MAESGAAYQPYADERTVGAAVTFELIDVDAAVTADVTADAGTWFSEPEQTVDKITTMSYRVATLEPDEWRLDGGYVLIKEDNNGEVGYWSEALSDAAGVTSVTCEFSFATPQSSRAFTVVFDDLTGDCAEDFTISAYSGATELATQEITGNQKAAIVVDMAADGYDKLVLTCTKTNRPKRRIRVCEMVFGFLQFFTDDEIAAMSIQYESTLDSQSLPAASLQLTLDNTERQYNIINPTGIYRYLQQGQGLNVSLFVGSERILMGRFYFDKAESDDNAMTVKITAYDRLFALGDSACNIGQAGTWTVAEAVAAVIADSGLEIGASIPSAIGSRLVGRGIPQGTTHREALRLIAQAGRAVCQMGREDALVFTDMATPAEDSTVDVLNDDRMAQLPKITDLGLVNQVILTVRDEYGSEGETTYTAESIQTGDPVQSISIVNPLAQGQEVADWILAQNQMRVQYDISERGNPARETLEWVEVYDIYGGQKLALVTKESFQYGLGLSGELVARTEQV